MLNKETIECTVDDVRTLYKKHRNVSHAKCYIANLIQDTNIASCTKCKDGDLVKIGIHTFCISQYNVSRCLC